MTYDMLYQYSVNILDTWLPLTMMSWCLYHRVLSNLGIRLYCPSTHGHHMVPGKIHACYLAVLKREGLILEVNICVPGKSSRQSALHMHLETLQSNNAHRYI